MNKRIISGILTAILCTALSGCGSYRTDEDMILPSMPPVLTPDSDDGVVTDRDTGSTAYDNRNADDRTTDSDRIGDDFAGDMAPSAPVQSVRPEATRQPGTNP